MIKPAKNFHAKRFCTSDRNATFVVYWDLKAKQLTSGEKFVNFNKRYQNTKKISIYIAIMAVLGDFNDLLRFEKLNFVIFYHTNFSMIVCKFRKIKYSSLCEISTELIFSLLFPPFINVMM